MNSVSLKNGWVLKMSKDEVLTILKGMGAAQEGKRSVSKVRGTTRTYKKRTRKRNAAKPEMAVILIGLFAL